MQLGYRIAYAAQAEIIHVHDESARRIYNRYRREAIALKRIFPYEDFHLWDFMRLFTGNVISDCYHAWHDRMLWHHWGSIFIFRLMQFWGTYQGFAQHGPVTSQLKQTFYYPNGLAHQSSGVIKAEPGRRIEYANIPVENPVRRNP